MKAVYTVGQIVEIMAGDISCCSSYSRFLGVYEYPLGTRFMIAKVFLPGEYSSRYGLKLLFDGEVIEQTGRTDGVVVDIPESAYSLLKVSHKLKLLNDIKDFK